MMGTNNRQPRLPVSLDRPDLGQSVELVEMFYRCPSFERPKVDTTPEPYAAGDLGFLAAWHGGEMLAGASFYICKSSILVADFAVLPECRRNGIGRALFEQLAAGLSPGRKRFLGVALDERNLGGQLFLRACGARATCCHEGRIEFARYWDEKGGV